MKRSSLLIVLLCCVFAAPASASYLHVDKVLPRAYGFITADARYQQATASSFGHCWHNAPRIVECSYTLQGVAVCEADPDSGSVDCPMDGVVEPTQWYIIAVLRGGRVHLHAG